MQNKNKSFYDIYHRSLEKVFEQILFWENEKEQDLQEGNLHKASIIEKKYLIPLTLRLKKLSHIAKEELKNGN